MFQQIDSVLVPSMMFPSSTAVDVPTDFTSGRCYCLSE